MRVLVTRPQTQAQSFAEALAAHGHEALMAPVLRHAPRPPPDGFAARLAAAQAILLTSINGARALAEATAVRGYRIVAVGDATAGAARQAGFSNVASAGGDAQALIGFASRQLSPGAGPLIHVGGMAKAGNVAASLRAAGFAVEEVALYDMIAAESLPSEITGAIQDGRVDAVAFFSPRTAEAFVKLATQAGIAPYLAGVAAVAISPAAQAAADGIPWRTRIVARAPTQDGVLAALDGLAPSSTGSPSMSDDSKKTATDAPAETAPPSGAADDAGSARATGQAPPPVVRRGMGVVGAFITGIFAAIVVLAVALIFAATRPDIVARLLQAGGTDPAARPVSSATLSSALKPLDERIAQVEAKARMLDSVAGQATQIKALQDKLAAQEQRLAALQDLAARVDALPRGGEPEAARRIAADLAQLRQELAPLRADIAALKIRQETAETTLRSLAERPGSAAAGQPGAAADLPADAARQIAVLNDRLERIEKREVQIGSTLAGAVDGAALARALGESEARLREQLARHASDIESARSAVTTLAQRVAALEKDVTTRLDAVRQTVAARSEGEQRAGDNGRAAAAIGIAARLRQAIDAGGPFSADADLLKPLAEGDPAIAAVHAELAPFAAVGVTTLRTLAAEFPAVARRVIAADTADDSWGERLLGRLKQLVSIRRVGEDTKGATPEAIVARAEAALQAGELAKAVAEMKNLTGPAAEPARAWLVGAETHLAAQRAIDRLSLHSIGLLSRTAPK